MLPRLAIMALCLTLVFGGIFGFELFKQKKTAEYLKSFTPPPASVSAEQATEERWTPTLGAVGSLLSLQGVEISSEQSGIVSRILFRSGQTVSKGELLLQLDDSVEQANLKSFRAQLNLAELVFERDKTLLARKAISQTRFDQSKAELDQAQAQVQQTQAIIQQKSIRAPFSGTLGIRNVELGQFLSSGTEIVTLQAAQKLYIDFNLPEQHVPLLRQGQPLEFQVEAYPDTVFIGQIQALDARIDSRTRNILVRAIVDNPDNRLTPGMFADISVQTGQPQAVVTLPETAISYSLYGDTVFKVSHNEQGKQVVQRQPVTTGRIRNNRVEILEGVKAGDQVVTSGQIKLNSGTEVMIVDAPAQDL
ncbi:efflux RND transporter periplasmic adaptor subunit [Aestuariirhabdus litorea]|uniref:Efflux RND transporter periplasmic adaptor subunit n=1 Tax=Aestuariirhabdus litorea TaxID=2528527 RepID=A0A3P3VSH7_9GAMM|nr:efflux RND transporter periplasmic adaptor subunit [Aestuariirhabdus litorea]RRJ84646.1 efflux RND transporter periplasmic adaptor subunit [Aestuariirhabdus litorea]RWW97871.1 efflux RND transporter periplasmic adaptor subunit [Endozoicomonadaceae bacterium GTF-13]